MALATDQQSIYHPNNLNRLRVYNVKGQWPDAKGAESSVINPEKYACYTTLFSHSWFIEKKYMLPYDRNRNNSKFELFFKLVTLTL